MEDSGIDFKADLLKKLNVKGVTLKADKRRIDLEEISRAEKKTKVEERLKKKFSKPVKADKKNIKNIFKNK